MDQRTSQDSISNPMDQRTSQKTARDAAKQYKEWVQGEAKMLDTAVEDRTSLEKSLASVLTRVQEQQHLLQAYAHVLPALQATEQTGNTFCVTSVRDDVTMKINTETLHSRLCDVMYERHTSPFSADVKTLITQLQDLLSKSGKCTYTLTFPPTQYPGVCSTDKPYASCASKWSYTGISLFS
jgi:hypothetical protein